MSAAGHIRGLRVAAYRKQDGRCFYCGTLMWESSLEAPRVAFQRLQADGLPSYDNLNDRRCTAEHLVRRVDGGPNTSRNIRASCFPCNLSRGMRTVGEHLGAKRPTPPPLPATSYVAVIEAVQALAAQAKPRSRAAIAAYRVLKETRTAQLKQELGVV